MSKTIIIIGAGLAGLSAALQAAENGCNVKLVSSLPSERAQSVMAEGGINAALNTKDENDSPEEHFTDTIKAACGLADPNAVWGMTQAAPELVHWLLKLGVKFNMSGYDDVDLRNFGGQKKKRTAFAQSDTGKQIMTAMIDAVRRKEASGMVERFSHHSFLTLRLCGNICCGCVIRDEYSQETVELPGDAVIVATGGMHGLFGNTTGSLSNTGEVTAELFRLGVPLANGEMIQYHPTTVKCGGKRMLISEAARGVHLAGQDVHEHRGAHERRGVAGGGDVAKPQDAVDGVRPGAILPADAVGGGNADDHLGERARAAQLGHAVEHVLLLRGEGQVVVVAVPLGVAALAHAAAEEDDGGARGGREKRRGGDGGPGVLVDLPPDDVLGAVGVELPGVGVKVKAGGGHGGVKAGHVLGGVAEGDDLAIGGAERQGTGLVLEKDDALAHGGGKGLGLVGHETTDSFLASEAPGVLQPARPARTAAEALPRTNPLRVMLSFMFFPSSHAPVWDVSGPPAGRKA